ncbi:MAG: alpha-amylase family glycosyl hydrolase [Schleiferiaceae bacterium]|nr:alpha-amylase family glycosyl hydrolase [Schleiferiaceae bacterium]
MRKLITLSCAAFLLACTTNSKEQSTNFKFSDPNELVGLASPIQLGIDTTFVELGDYFLHPEKIDSITVPSGLNVSRNSETQKLTITGTMNARMGNASFWSKDDQFDIPLKSSTQVKFEYTFNAQGKDVETLEIMGSFNAWNRNANSFSKEGDIFKTSFVLFPGQYKYKLFINGNEVLDPLNSDSVSNGMGGFNSVVQVGEEELNPLRIEPIATELGSVLIETRVTEDELHVYWQNRKLSGKDITKAAKGLWINLPIAESTGRSFLRVWAANNRSLSNDLLIPLQDGKFVTETAQLNRSDWEKSVFYFLMVDRFQNGNPSNDEKVDDPDISPKANYFGGDVAGVTQKLKDGYFEELGINTIWLSPITQNPKGAWGLWDKGGAYSKFSGYHGYWPVSNVKPDYRFASPEEVKELLDEAHKRDMNVILDYVANHVHEEHPIYQQNKDWATNLYLPDGSMNTERWDDHRLTTWFDTFLPTLDLRRPEVVEPLTDSALVWVTEYNFDGFRHDATKHIDELYWRVLMKKLKERVMVPQQKRVYQIGETYGSPDLINSYIGSGMLDAQFDFNLFDAAVGAFAKGDDFENLKNTLEASLNTYGYHHLMGNISGNQDRSRFITLADGELDFAEDQKLAGWTREFGKPKNASSYQKLELMHAFNMAVPGIPVIYYGDEYGMPGANDPDNRRQMLFDGLDEDEQKARDVISQLVKLRETNMALIYGTTSIELTEEGLMVIARTYLGQTVWVVLNNSDEELSMEWPSEPNTTFGNAKWGDSTLSIPAYSFEYIILNK